jgi:cyclohexadieny/prephenate dehydrogenase
MLPFARVAIIGMGLIGASLARAIRQTMPNVHLTVSDGDAGVRARVVELDLADDVTENAGAAVIDAELVILAVPVGAMRGSPPKSPMICPPASSSPMSDR